MSKIPLKPSRERFSKKSKSRKQQEASILKPFGFCCSADKIDPLTKYDILNEQYKAVRKPVYKIHESPTLKLRTHFSGTGSNERKRKYLRNKNLDIGDHRRKNYMRNLHNSTNLKDSGKVFIPEDLHDDRVKHMLQGPLKWYLDDEIGIGKSVLWKKRQKAYNEEMDRNTKIGKKKVQLITKGEIDIYPPWYQDLSTEQIKNLKILQCIMHRDCKQMVTGRTQRTFLSIGVISTFFPLAPEVIKKLQESTNCNVIQFLREVYKILTGNYFEEEEHKKSYDCNERIILSAIAFLTLPEAVTELQKRLPPVKIPKLYSKPTPPSVPIRFKMNSPYEEKLFLRPDWASYLNQLQNWREQHELTPIPKLILPPKDCIISSFENTETSNGEDRSNTLHNIPKNQLAKNNFPNRTKQKYSTSISKRQEKNVSDNMKQTKSTKRRHSGQGSAKEKNVPANSQSEDIEENSDVDDEISAMQIVQKQEPQKFEKLDVPPLYENTLFDFTINGISARPGPVDYKICGVLQPPQPNTKSWLGEKHAHYVITGASDEPPTCPVTYEMTGIANVTPSNSDEKFLAVLKLGDGPNKIYPAGRKNLSRHWQEWLQNVDEEFRKVENEANRMIKNIEAVTKLVFPRPACDSCCSCRQTRKSYLKSKETKAPYFVIDTITEDDSKQKYIVGSMAMHSPSPTPPESTVNLLEVIASEDVLTTNLIINGVMNEKGEMQYFITGTKEEVIRVPGRIVERPPPLPPRNVPPCVCAIQQVFNKGLDPTNSHDNIPWTKEDGLCFGKKFRPQESPAYSCKMYPGDKSCRRSPFMNKIIKLKERAERAKKSKEGATAEKKRMYSIADFQPCGDEHGMSICGGPWGALHILSPEELAEQERERKEILRGPPCGTKPGRAICEGPFGEKVPSKPPPSFKNEIPGEEDEEEEEEEEEEKQEGKEEVKPAIKERERKRDQRCYTSPQTVTERKKAEEKKITKFIQDPDYPGYDDPWNIFRTAPPENVSETDFKTLLKLSSPKPPATPVQSKLMIESRKKPAEEDTLKFSSKEERPKRKTFTREKSEHKLIEKKTVVGKFKSETEVSKAIVTSAKPKGTQSKELRKVRDKPVKSKTAIDKTKDTKLSKPVSKRDRVTDEKPAVARRSKKSSQTSRYNEIGINKESPTRQVKKCKSSEKKLHNLPNAQIAKSDVDVRKRKKLSAKVSLSTNSKSKKVDKQFPARKGSTMRDKRKYMNSTHEDDSQTQKRNKVNELRNMMKLPDVYPYDIKPADIPEDIPGKCKSAYEEAEAESNILEAEDDAGAQLPSKGPCGWKTKSEQQLPTKKTLVHLTDPDYPKETISVKPGGKPCLCRENRAKKKILLYNIGGLIGGKKDDDETKLLKKKKGEDKKMQVIDGVIYYTPPPSPRRSEEYIPEYDLCDSPYDMCTTRRKDQNLKYLERYSKPKAVEGSADEESCGCNQYIDTYGVKTTPEEEEKAMVMKELDQARERLMHEMEPKKRWDLALKDVELSDYFTRCRNSMPCWLKCVKFNKEGCVIPKRKLKVKRPVCECKYERNVFEYREEKLKSKERQKRLKSLKKQPFVNITDISKPLVPNRKLIISGVKRIPREDEYIDDIKYSITGVAEHYSHLPVKQVVGAVSMATPVHTPEPSKEEIPCVCLHRHWSPTDITPGPLPRPGELMLAERKRRQEAVKDAFQKIYSPEPVYHSHDDHGCEGKCNQDADIGSDGETTEADQVATPFLQQTKRQAKASVNITEVRKASEIKGRTSQRETKQGRDGNQLTNEPINLNVENADSSNKDSKEDQGDSKSISLVTIVKIELQKMATEGFVFAKLPKCFLMPQLRYWLMYRNGIALSNADKQNLLRKTFMMWNLLDTTPQTRVEPPPLEMTQVELSKLTFDNALEMKEKIATKETLFFSQVRKRRVSFSRTMWNTMEYGKFPSVSFKQAYFTYMASKEADGHVFKPWLPSEVRKAN